MAKSGTAKTKKQAASKATTQADTPSRRRRALPLVGALAGGFAAAVAGILYARRRADAPAAGHRAPDLERSEHPGPDDRADAHFRPDMDAPMSAADRAALAPALAKPTLVDG